MGYLMTIDATVYYLKEDGKIEERTAIFDCNLNNFENHLTSIYGNDNMENVEWDIWEPPPDEGFEEEDQWDSDMSKYLKKKSRRRK